MFKHGNKQILAPTRTGRVHGYNVFAWRLYDWLYIVNREGAMPYVNVQSWFIAHLEVNVYNPWLMAWTVTVIIVRHLMSGDVRWCPGMAWTVTVIIVRHLMSGDVWWCPGMAWTMAVISYSDVNASDSLQGIIIYLYKIAILHHGMQSFRIIVYCTPVYCTLVYWMIVTSCIYPAL